MYIYHVYHTMSKSQQQKTPSKLSENEEKKMLFSSFSMVFSITFMLILLPFLTATLCESDTRKAIFWSKTVYNKNLSSQCNLIAQIKPMQDKNVIIFSKTNLLVFYIQPLKLTKLL